jgi:hypothetical protein
MDHQTLDSSVHHAVLNGIVERGHAPTVDDLAALLRIEPRAVSASLQRLHATHGVVLHPGTCEVWVAHPFSLSPTNVWVSSASGSGWWAPCLWCAFGVAELTGGDATIHARIGGQSESVQVRVQDGAGIDEIVVHFSIPVAQAWNNVVHWCATVQPFRSGKEVDAWCRRHGLPRGELLPASTVWDLAKAWYGRHLERDWQKVTTAEAREIFRSVGLRGSFWELPSGDTRF